MPCVIRRVGSACAHVIVWMLLLTAQLPMKEANKWKRRNKAEFKLCWYVVTELFSEWLPPQCRFAAPVEPLSAAHHRRDQTTQIVRVREMHALAL